MSQKFYPNKLKLCCIVSTLHHSSNTKVTNHIKSKMSMNTEYLTLFKNSQLNVIEEACQKALTVSHLALLLILYLLLI